MIPRRAPKRNDKADNFVRNPQKGVKVKDEAAPSIGESVTPIPVERERISTPLRVLKASSAQTVKLCEECGEELADRRVRVKGHVMTIVHCPRCTPDPLQVLQG